MIRISRILNRDLAIEVPPSKAHTLRSLILAALADGTSVVRNPLLGEDQLHLLECLARLGVTITRREGEIGIVGTGGRFKPVADTLDCGESGVAMNFLSALACLASRPVVLTGKEGLLKRPVDEIVSGIRQLGGSVEYLDNEGLPPLRANSSGLSGGVARMKGAKTSQYFSSLSIAAACAKADVTIECVDEMSEKPYLDITLAMMRRFGVEATNDGYRTIAVKSGQRYHAADVTVEGDYSSASYFIEAAAVTGATVFLKGLERESAQGDRRIVDYARTMGCAVEFREGGLTVSGGPLRPIDESFFDTPDLVPTVAVMAAFAAGTSRIRDVAHLRFKECDRIAAVIEGLSRMGITAFVEGNDLVVQGDPTGAHGGAISSWNDHRIAMCFAVAGLVLDGQTIDDGACVKKSFPNFWETFAAFGR
ncbi:MAG TPA: 3-phosphoshikimate 1-carboxyvinyltransferase [Treponemataceae bacterium]|nr:3-phosphoshikimate 1-carboxyvinyltransferase [Treponemataceae bacterium]